MINSNFIFKPFLFAACLGILCLTSNLNARETKNEKIKEIARDELDEEIEEFEELIDTEEQLTESQRERLEEIQRKTNKAAKKIEKKFWQLVQNRERKKLKLVILKNFQGNGPHGKISRKEEIDRLSELHIECFSIKDVEAHSISGVLTVTYKFYYAASGCIGNHVLSVWKKNNCKQWRLVSRAFSPIDVTAAEAQHELASEESSESESESE